MFAQPGKKLIFMGSEFGQEAEWNHDQSLDWHLLNNPLHSGLQRWVEDLNRMYQREPALHELDFTAGGFEWIDCNDSRQSTLSLIRRGHAAGDLMIVVFNFTPVPRLNYRIGAPRGGFWREVLNSDAKDYGGSGWGTMGGVTAVPVPFHGRPCSIAMALPPLAVIFFKNEEEEL
jgi:1,4-alpha-glucan branching enzyme